jgi:general secretion pathway protein L
MTRLLIFLRGEDDLAWLRLDGDAVVARGGAHPVAEPDETVIAVAPGEAVTLHWVEMPALAPAQAAAAGRIAASEVCAAPIGEAHVAVGPRDDDGYCCLAVVNATAMAGWLARCRAAGLDPDHVVPSPLLIAPPADGVRVAEAGDLILARGPRLAFAAEPALAALLIGDAAPDKLEAPAFEAGLGAALAALPVDLRQGAFAKARPWRLDWKRLRRTAAWAALILLSLPLISLALMLRHGLAADVAERELANEARRVLPRGAEIVDPVAQVEARLAETGAAGPGFSTAAAALFAALRDVAGAELTSLRYADRQLTAAVSTAQGGDLALIQERLRAAGFEATPGAPRTEAGKSTIELTVRPR